MKRPSFILYITMHLCHKSGNNICVGLFLDSPIYSIVLSGYPYTNNIFFQLLYYYNKSWSPTLFSFNCDLLQDCQLVLALHFNVNLRIGLSIFTYKYYWHFDWNCIKLISKFKENWQGYNIDSFNMKTFLYSLGFFFTLNNVL